MSGDFSGNLRRLLNEARADLERATQYDYARVIEGNDGRGIDVGVLSRRPLLRVTSHAHWTYRDFDLWTPDLAAAIDGERRNREEHRSRPGPGDRIFRRDCLEIEVDAGGGKVLTMFVCHLKANPPHREATYPIRLAEAKAVKRIIRTRFGAGTADAAWVICGDLNDYVEIDGSEAMPDLVTGQSTRSALTPLLEAADGRAPFAFDACQLIADPRERWTSYYPRDDVYAQLDHILLSPALWRGNQDKVPRIGRSGQPYRAQRHAGPRYPRTGFDRPKASDHCPITIDLDL
jgi:endonuclease/exonuclease/phosphatase family metal-dependent hydrolase